MGHRGISSVCGGASTHLFRGFVIQPLLTTGKVVVLTSFEGFVVIVEASARCVPVVYAASLQFMLLSGMGHCSNARGLQ